MKRGFLLFLLAIVINGCEDVEKLLSFPVNDRANFRIESASPINLPFEIATPSVTSNSTREFQNHNTSADLVKDVRLEDLKLTITAPSGKTFTFLRSIRIFISAEQQSEIELASLENISSTAGVLELIPTKQKLDAYAKASSYRLRTQITTDETLTEDVDVQIDLRFKVTADTF
jgi:hypothetical protein